MCYLVTLRLFLKYEYFGKFLLGNRPTRLHVGLANYKPFYIYVNKVIVMKIQLQKGGTSNLQEYSNKTIYS